jgi:hypothetical protein
MERELFWRHCFLVGAEMFSARQGSVGQRSVSSPPVVAGRAGIERSHRVYRPVSSLTAALTHRHRPSPSRFRSRPRSGRCDPRRREIRQGRPRRGGSPIPGAAGPEFAPPRVTDYQRVVDLVAEQPCPQACAFRLVAGRDDDFGAEMAGQQCGSRPERRGGALHDHPLSGCEAGTHELVHRHHAGEGHRDGVRRCHVVRDGEHVGFGNRDVVRRQSPSSSADTATVLSGPLNRYQPSSRTATRRSSRCSPQSNSKDGCGSRRRRSSRPARHVPATS